MTLSKSELNCKADISDRSINFYAAIDSAQSHLELCAVNLESLMIEVECRDMAHFGAVRLRLAHANLTRTRVAQEVCKYLISTMPENGVQALRDLLQYETAHFQMISQHIQQWTTRAVQCDWHGYREATRKLLERTRELIAMEKSLFFPLLRQGY